MKDIFKVIKTRRSIRKWKKKKVPKRLIMKILDLARYAPSSHNSQPWEFVVVDDKRKIKQLMKARNGESNKMEPPLIIAVCVDIKRSPFRWIEDGSVAAENILLVAHALGLGAVWLTAYKHPIYLKRSKIEKTIVKVLGLPKFIRPLCLIAMGYPDEKPAEKPMRELKTMIHYNKFGVYKRC